MDNKSNKKSYSNIFIGLIISIFISIMFVFFIAYINSAVMHYSNLNLILIYIAWFVFLSILMFAINYKVVAVFIIAYLVISLVIPFVANFGEYGYYPYSYSVFNFNKTQIVSHNYVYGLYYNSFYSNHLLIFILPISELIYKTIPNIIITYNPNYSNMKWIINEENNTSQYNCYFMSKQSYDNAINETINPYNINLYYNGMKICHSYTAIGPINITS